MNIHNTHKITHQQYNGLLDPWHVCTVCGKSDKELETPCGNVDSLDVIKHRLSILEQKIDSLNLDENFVNYHLFLPKNS